MIPYTNGPILLVEDDANDIILTQRTLQKNRINNEIVVVRDGLEALDYLFNTGKYAGPLTLMPELVLLDLQLPKLDGLQVLELMKSEERTRRLPVIILTSSGNERDRIDSYGLGAISYIRKPVDFTEFFGAVCQRGLSWLVVNKLSSAAAYP